MTQSPETSRRSQPPTNWRWEWLLIALSFAIFASIRAPVPGVNEPHYFSKAKHFWDAQWCARDPFLQSANAHYVFYATFGTLTKVFTLTQSAWIGRLIGWALLASGWCALAARLSPIRWFGLWSAWVFLGLATIGNWSGEWVVGGIEAKVISYACAWWSLAWVLDGKWVRSGAWAGLSVCFHPVIGIWHTGAAVLAAISTQDFKSCVKLSPRLLLAGIGWGLFAASGLIPALSIVRGADAKQAFAADFIQVFHRLKHHLDPFQFHMASNSYYAVMVVLVICLSYFGCQSVPGLQSRWKVLVRYAFVAVLIALAGLAIRSAPRMANGLLSLNLFPFLHGSLKSIIAQENQLAKWLKFYPFRLADVTIPLVLALQTTRLIVHWYPRWTSRVFRQRPELRSGAAGEVSGSPLLNLDTALDGGSELVSTQSPLSPMKGFCLFGVVYLVAIVSSIVGMKLDHRLRTELFPDWREACLWLRHNTASNALCYVPSQGFGLKWYAERAEYVSQKDCPQDAAGIVAWNDRLRLIGNWSRQHANGRFTMRQVQELQSASRIDYLIIPKRNSKLAALPLVPVYQNESYQIFRISPE